MYSHSFVQGFAEFLQHELLTSLHMRRDLPYLSQDLTADYKYCVEMDSRALLSHRALYL